MRDGQFFELPHETGTGVAGVTRRVGAIAEKTEGLDTHQGWNPCPLRYSVSSSEETNGTPSPVAVKNRS
jgi:hypothetical protein